MFSTEIRIRFWQPTTCLQIFRILKFQKEKKLCSNFSFFWIFVKFGQTMVKLLIQEVLVLLNNYSIILVLLNNYFSFFEFWSNMVKLWSNNGQTTYSRNISVTKNLLFFRTIVSNSNSEMCDFMLKLNSWGLIGLTSYYCQENNKCRLGNEGE